VVLIMAGGTRSPACSLPARDVIGAPGSAALSAFVVSA